MEGPNVIVPAERVRWRGARVVGAAPLHRPTCRPPLTPTGNGMPCGRQRRSAGDVGNHQVAADPGRFGQTSSRASTSGGARRRLSRNVHTRDTVEPSHGWGPRLGSRGSETRLCRIVVLHRNGLTRQFKTRRAVFRHTACSPIVRHGSVRRRQCLIGWDSDAAPVLHVSHFTSPIVRSVLNKARTVKVCHPGNIFARQKWPA